MKAWELIKHLEEGGKLVNDIHQTFNKTNITLLQIRYIWNLPESWEIVKPKKKYKFFRHWYIEVTGVRGCSGWVPDTWMTYPEGDKLLKTEEKEIEVDV